MLAARAKVGRQWLIGFELGDKHSAPLDMVFRVLSALDLDLTLTPPPPQTSPPPIDLDEIINRHTGPAT